MGVMPNKRPEKIAFCEVHNPIWQAAAASIGVVAADITLLETKTALARTKYDEHLVAQAAAKNATAAYYNAVADMSAFTMAQVKKIKAKADVDGPGVYTLASIPAPAEPSPVGPPGTPYKFKLTLNPDGSLKFTWACDNPSGSQGTIYQVARRIGSSGAFVRIGGTGAKEFIDATIPAGTASVTYEVQAIRSTALGVAALLTVNFGVGGGEMTMSVTEAAAPAPAKIAA